MALQEDTERRKPRPRRPEDVVAQHGALNRVAADQARARKERVDLMARLARRVEELVIQGAVIQQIERILTGLDEHGRAEFDVKLAIVRKIHVEVVAELARVGREKSTPTGREATRQAALRRLHDLRGVALFGEREVGSDGKPTGKWLHRPSLLMAHLIEKQIARIEGTEAPRKLDVRVDVQGQAVAEIMVALDEDARRELEAEAAAEAELVGKARKLLPAKARVVDAEIVEAESRPK